MSLLGRRSRAEVIAMTYPGVSGRATTTLYRGCAGKPELRPAPGCRPESAVHPLDAVDRPFAAQLRDDRREVLQVPDRQVDGDVGEVLGAALHRDVVDVAVV